jgi:hypothetical protein
MIAASTLIVAATPLAAVAATSSTAAEQRVLATPLAAVVAPGAGTPAVATNYSTQATFAAPVDPSSRWPHGISPVTAASYENAWGRWRLGLGPQPALYGGPAVTPEEVRAVVPLQPQARVRTIQGDGVSTRVDDKPRLMTTEFDAPWRNGVRNYFDLRQANTVKPRARGLAAGTSPAAVSPTSVAWNTLGGARHSSGTLYADAQHHLEALERSGVSASEGIGAQNQVAAGASNNDPSGALAAGTAVDPKVQTVAANQPKLKKDDTTV